MKASLIILLLFLSIKSSFAQTLQSLQSMGDVTLRKKIESSSNNIKKVNFILALGRNMLFRPGSGKHEVDSAYFLMKQAEKLSAQLKDVSSQGNTLLLAALIANKKRDKNNGVSNSQKAIYLFRKINDVQNIGEAYIILGQSFDDDNKKMFYSVGNPHAE